MANTPKGKSGIARQISRREGRDEFEAMEKENRRLNELAFHRAQQVGDFFWEGVDPRRRIELAQGGMVREDRNAMANLPMQAIHTEYPELGINSYGFGTNQLIDAERLDGREED